MAYGRRGRRSGGTVTVTIGGPAAAAACRGAATHVTTRTANATEWGRQGPRLPVPTAP